MTAPLPVGFGIALDRQARELEPHVWYGGSPARVLRLTPAGRSAWERLSAGAVTGAADGQLARRLTDAGLAHPVPPVTPAPADVTVVVPAYDRADRLDACLAALGTAHPVVVVDDGSRDAEAVAAVVERHGARLLRREVNGGPAAARNTGLAAVDSAFVAFVDSDCVPPPGWLEPLLAHLADPLVAAVAPRVSALAPATWLGRYTTARGSLDLGAQPGVVGPGRRVAYVPTAALLVRRSALPPVVFDPGLRFGEDVDLVWRLGAAGWRVRYEPAASVAHHEPVSWKALLRRRFQYGTSAAPLSARHPGATAPLHVHPWSAATAALALTGHPLLAAASFGLACRATARARATADLPARGSVTAMANGVGQTTLALGRYATQFAAPALVVLAASGRTGRLAAAGLALAGPLDAWRRDSGGLDPLRFTLAHTADELAYGAGVIAGCLRGRTTEPLRPRLIRRPRVQTPTPTPSPAPTGQTT